MDGETVSPESIGVLGAGSWGTALAILLASHGRPTWLWARDAEQVAEMQTRRRNPRFLPDAAFPDALTPSHELDAILDASRDLLIVVPSHGFREVIERIRPRLRDDARVAWATKGLEPGTGRFLHEVVQELLGPTRPAAVMSGPTFAKEVVAGLPTAITVAATDRQFAQGLALRLHSERFRIYLSDDMVGVQLGGSIKNVLAIGAGIADGLGFGANTRAALITRGLVEMMRLGEAMGGRRWTFMGLAGLGDLVLTCTDTQSRNLRMGLALAKGMTVGEAEASIGQVVEGVRTAQEVYRLSQQRRVEMPISEQVYAVLHQGVRPLDAVQTLLAREDAHTEV